MEDYVFPTNPPCSPYGPQNRISGEDREYVYDFLCCTQTGTHIQGPHYFVEDGKRINEFPLECFEGMAVVIDVPTRELDEIDLRGMVECLDLEKKILILRSGHMDRVILTKKIGDRPGLSLAAARYLVEEKRIRMIAIDSIGIECGKDEGRKVSVYLCQKEVLILEGLVNLCAITESQVFLEAFPLKLRGVEGTPCRAFVRQEVRDEIAEITSTRNT
jgi:kynurenine formamidase